MRIHRITSRVAAAGILALMAAPTVWADEDERPTDEQQAEFGEEITVTGQQQVRGLQDTTDSVAVTTGKALEDNSTVDLYQLVELTPNVNPSFGFQGFAIRGIDQRGFGGGGGQLVTVRVDGATLQNNQSTIYGPYSAWDLGQVEIFRGPQSTQQGRNALAGAIVIRSADPTYEQEVKGRISAGSLGSTRVSAAANLPLVDDRVALRLSLDTRDSDGWVENPTRGEDDYSSRESVTARAKLRVDFTERLNALLTLSYTDSRGGEDTIDPSRFPERLNFSNDDAEEGSLHEIVNLELNYLLSDRWTLQSTTNFYKHDYVRIEDGDMSPLTGNLLNIDQEDEGFSQQLRFLYSGDGGRQAVFGVYYADLEDDSVSAATLPGQVLDLPPGFSVTGSLEAEVETENLAVFGEIDLPLGERFVLTAGARFDTEDQRNFSSQVTMINPPVFMLPIQPPQDLEASYDAFLPKLGLTYEISENSSASFTVQEGYRAGGRSQSLITLTVSDFDPERTTNYDFAYRSLFPEQGLRFNANLFFIDWRDQQVNVRTAIDSEFDTITVNAGESRLYGAEAQLDYRVREGLDLFASVGLVETEFLEFTDGPEDFAGNEFPFAPPFSATLGTRWLPADRWTVDASVNYQDSYFSDQDNNPDFTSDSRTLVNLRVSYDWRSVTLAAFARNLFDEDFLTQAFPGGARAGEPQVVGLELSFGL
ncbi:MAG: TonB-dependent receptor [Acidobacteriota bacterium]